MPIYEYRCTACGHEFETLVRNSSDNPTACPKCEQPRLKKLFSTFSPSVASPRPACSDGSCEAAAQCPTAGTGACSTGSCPF